MFGHLNDCSLFFHHSSCWAVVVVRGLVVAAIALSSAVGLPPW
jgi:hypothetical protein